MSKNIVLHRYPCELCGSWDSLPIADKDRDGVKMHVSICRECGLVQTNPREDEDDYVSYFSRQYRIHQDVVRYFEEQYRTGEGIYNYLKAWKPKSPVLEIGAGAGGILLYFKEKGFHVHGYDLDEQYIDYGRWRGVNMMRGTISYTIHDLSMYRLIIMTHVLEHLSHPLRDLSYLRRRVSKDALIFISVPTIDSIFTNFSGDFQKYLTRAHVYHFTKGSLRNMIERAGFEILQMDGHTNCICRVPQVKNEFHHTMRILKVLDYYKHAPVLCWLHGR